MNKPERDEGQATRVAGHVLRRTCRTLGQVAGATVLFNEDEAIGVFHVDDALLLTLGTHACGKALCDALRLLADSIESGVARDDMIEREQRLRATH